MSYTLSNAERAKLWKAPTDRWRTLLLTSPKYAAQKQNLRLGTSSHVDKVEVPCFHPSHADRTPSAVINFKLGFAKCLSCKQYTADPVQLVGWINGVNYKAAALDSYRRLNVKPPKDQSDALELYEDVTFALEALRRVAHTLLVRTYDDPTKPAHAPYVDAMTYLQSRNISKETCIEMGVGVMPLWQDLFRNFKTASVQRKFTNAFDTAHFGPGGSQVGPYTGWIMFPYGHAPGELTSFKLRKPNSKSQLRLQPKVASGFNSFGYFGLEVRPDLFYAQAQSLKQSHSNFDLVLVEGEFDAMAGVEFQMRGHAVPGGGAGIVTTPYICLSGGAGSDLTGFDSLGPSRLICMGDNDDAGKVWTERLLTGEGGKTERRGYRYDLSLRAGADPAELLNDPDPAAALAFYNSIDPSGQALPKFDFLLEEFHAAYLAAMTEPEQVRTALLHAYAGYSTGETSEGQQYLEQLAAVAGVDYESLIVNATTALDTEEGFYAYIKHLIQDTITPLVVEDMNLVFALNARGTTHKVPFTFDTKMYAKFVTEAFGGKEDWYFVHGMEPPCLAGDGKKPRSLGQRKREAELLTIQAIRAVAGGVSYSNGSTRVYKQGVHAVFAPGSDASRTPVVHIVNGVNHLAAMLDPATDERPRWETIRDPAPYSNTIFWTDPKAQWSDFLQTAEVLNAASDFDKAKELFDQTEEMLRHGWTFEDPVVGTVLAGLVYGANLHQIGSSCPMFHITGETSSGKSSLLKFVFGRSGSVDADMLRWNLVEHSQFLSSYTSAALWQTCRGDSRLLLVDEFENDAAKSGDKKSGIVQSAYDTFRDISQGATIERGSQTGEVQTHHIRTGVLTAGINRIQEEVDANRYFTVVLLRRPQNPPFHALMSRYEEKEFLRIKANAAVYGLQNANVIYRNVKELQRNVVDELIKRGQSVREVRVLLQLIVPLAVAQHFGRDPIDIAQRLLKIHEKTLSKTVERVYDKIFTDIFYTRSIEVPNDGVMGGRMQKSTVRELLETGAGRKILTSYGIFCDNEKHRVIVHVPLARQHIVARNSTTSRIDNAMTVCTKLASHPDASTGLKPDTTAAVEALGALSGRNDTPCVMFPYSMFHID